MFVAILSLFVFLTIRQQQAQEPEYEGRKLSSWLVHFGPGITYTDEMIVERERAMLAMREKALPILLKEIQCADSYWKYRFTSWVNLNDTPFGYIAPDWRRRERAENAILVISMADEAILPKLKEIISTKELREDVCEAIQHLIDRIIAEGEGSSVEYEFDD